MILDRIEEFVPLFEEYVEQIKNGMKQLSNFSYYHHGVVFSYIQATNKKGEVVHSFTENSLLIFRLVGNNLEYIVNDNEIVEHSIDILEDRHFQMSTQKPLITFEVLPRIKEICRILENK